MPVFTDRVDEDVKVSLYEYGVIRNPQNGKTVLCVNTGDYLYGDAKPKIIVKYIEFIDVLEVLQDIDERYFDYIGSSREVEINDLNNNYLTDHIMDLNSWAGIFSDENW